MSDGVVSFEGEGHAETVDETNNVPSSQRGRFEPGRSGNPKGRPRKRAKEQSAIEAALNERVTIKDRKGTRKLSAAQAIAKRLVQKAMAGDIPALKELQRASPNFLKEVKKEASKHTYNAFIRHLVNTMSESASMEYRNALVAWEQKRLEPDDDS